MATAAVEFPTAARDRAFESLYRRYAKDVYRYALAVLRNPADAEDITQTTFLNAYRAIQRGEEPIKPQNWLIKIAHNAARSRYQRASRRVKEVPLDDHLEQLSVAEEDRPDVEAVLEALGNLPLNQRAALVMRELEGRSYAEISETLGVSVAAVETLIFRARRALRLKASSIRVLSVVQLPASLAQLGQLLEGGGGVAVGGSAVAGYGFIFKAAVAVVAAVVATGVGGDHVRRAQAEPAHAAVAPAPWSSVAALAFIARDAAAKSPALPPRQAAARLAAEPADLSASSAPASAAAASRTSDTVSAPPAATAIASAQTTLSQATSTVTSAVSSVVPSTPSVAVPQLPSVPQVPLPPPPPLPKLP